MAGSGKKTLAAEPFLKRLRKSGARLSELSQISFNLDPKYWVLPGIGLAQPPSKQGQRRHDNGPKNCGQHVIQHRLKANPGISQTKLSPGCAEPISTGTTAFLSHVNTNPGLGCNLWFEASAGITMVWKHWGPFRGHFSKGAVLDSGRGPEKGA